MAKNQGKQAVKLAQENAEFFTTPEGERYAKVLIAGNKAIYPVGRGDFSRWLKHAYSEKYAKLLSEYHCINAIAHLDAEVQFGGYKVEELYMRVAPHKGKLYIDLANDKYQAVEISKDGWKVIVNPPVNFRRTKAMLPLPEPQHGGTLALLKKYIHTEDDDDLMLINAWLIGALHPCGPYCILNLHGEHGSTKTTVTRFLTMLLDPRKGALRKEPRDDEALAVRAFSSYVVAMDNISYLSDSIADAICRLATRSGLAKKKLYTDRDEIVFDDCRPIIINGIGEIMLRGDMLDRSIIVQIPRMPVDKRLTEHDLYADFERDRPYILGALYDAISTAIRELPSTATIPNKPRMADAAMWMVAAEKHITDKQAGHFLKVYNERHHANATIALETSPLAQAVFDLMRPIQTWEGYADELLVALNSYWVQFDINTHTLKNWPQSSNAMSNQLSRLGEAFKERGIDIVKPKRSAAGQKFIITKLDTQPAPQPTNQQSPIPFPQHKQSKASMKNIAMEMTMLAGDQS